MQLNFSVTDTISFNRLAVIERRRKHIVKHIAKTYNNNNLKKYLSLYSISEIDSEWEKKSLHEIINTRTIKDLFIHIENEIYQNEDNTFKGLLSEEWGSTPIENISTEMHRAAFEAGVLEAASLNINLINNFEGVYELLQRIYISKHINPFILKRYTKTELKLERTNCKLVSMELCDYHLSWLKGILSSLGKDIEISTTCILKKQNYCEFKILYKNEK